jgi:TorA maturation chaperone TorD
MKRAEEARGRAAGYERLAVGFGPPSATELTAEYHRLFVGPGALPAPPYESVYREGWRVMGETTLDVRRRYEEAGYVFTPSVNEPPDHLAAELAFMALLAEEEAEAWEAEDASAALSWLERERGFLDDHLSRWLPAFCDRLLTSTDAPFYRGLAGALREFVALDAERVTALIGLLEETLA